MDLFAKFNPPEPVVEKIPEKKKADAPKPTPSQDRTPERPSSGGQGDGVHPVASLIPVSGGEKRSEEDDALLRPPPTTRFGTTPARAPAVAKPAEPSPTEGGEKTSATGSGGGSSDGGAAAPTPVSHGGLPPQASGERDDVGLLRAHEPVEAHGLPDPELANRKPGTPIIREIDQDFIEDWQVKDPEKRFWVPKKIGIIERTTRAAIVAWTGKTGWVVYAENRDEQKRAFYFYEAIDDSDLSYRCMTGQED